MSSQNFMAHPACLPPLDFGVCVCVCVCCNARVRLWASGVAEPASPTLLSASVSATPGQARQLLLARGPAASICHKHTARQLPPIRNLPQPDSYPESGTYPQ